MLDQLLTPEQLGSAAALLLGGGIVAFPTDTVYGLAAHPDFPAAVERLFEAKQRPLDKAIPWLIADAAFLDSVANDVSQSARRLAARFWPGALSIVLRRARVQPGEPETVAVRMPALDLARDLIRAAGGVLAVTSANRSGDPNCVTAPEVFAQLGGRIDAILDGGPCPGGVESTVIDATRHPAVVLRFGAVSRAELEAVVDVQPA